MTPTQGALFPLCYQYQSCHDLAMAVLCKAVSDLRFAGKRDDAERWLMGGVSSPNLVDALGIDNDSFDDRVWEAIGE